MKKTFLVILMSLLSAVGILEISTFVAFIQDGATIDLVLCLVFLTVFIALSIFALWRKLVEYLKK